MGLYDFKCEKCGYKFEAIIYNTEVKYTTCPKCGEIAEKLFSAQGQSFNLVYNPKKDICDWDGNKTRYYDEYNKMKAEGKNPRIPALDGE